MIYDPSDMHEDDRPVFFYHAVREEKNMLLNWLKGMGSDVLKWSNRLYYPQMMPCRLEPVKIKKRRK